MKATKIMGAVLGVLLVAALFTGAAAANNEEGTDVYLGNAYAYGLYDFTAKGVDLSTNSTWTDKLGNTVTFLPDGAKYYIDGAEVAAEGDYTLGFGGKLYHITVLQPTAAISGSVYNADKDGKKTGDAISALIGSTVMNDKAIVVNYGKLITEEATIAFTTPDGVTTVTPGAVHLDVKGNANLKAADLGIWTVQAYFTKGAKNVEALGEIDITQFAPDYILGKPYYFTIVSSDDSKKLVAVTPEIVQGGYATIEVNAPTGKWGIVVDSGSIPDGQPLVKLVDEKNAILTIGANGVGYINVTTLQTSNIKVELHEVKLVDGKEVIQSEVKKSVTVKVTSGAITAEAETASVFIGNDFDIEGTNDLGGALYFFIKGTNYKFQQIKDLTASGKVWDATVETGALVNNGKKPDAGTYTVYVASLTAEGEKKLNPEPGVTPLVVDDMDETKYTNAYATVSVALKQPFITITEAPEVLVQGEKLVVKGTAEGEPKNVQFYIFGTNYFNFGQVSVTDGEYSVEVGKEYTKKDYMGAGQYFLVIQHPMYDKNFNIGANFVTVDGKEYKPKMGESVLGDIVVNKKADVYDDKAVGTSIAVLFNTDERQSANAAQALCDNLDNQDIDDMYAKASFVVAGPTSYIDAIPSQITKGQVLTISGTTTGHKDDVVTVELLSTAFAAIPKEAVGSASFVALTTKIDESGVWSITFDTSNLNADEYTCSVAVGQLDATSSKITIVEGSTPVTPTQTAGPVTPTAQPTAQPTATPATPGFGALAALAGLGAVAVLLLRRQ